MWQINLCNKNHHFLKFFSFPISSLFSYFLFFYFYSLYLFLLFISLSLFFPQLPFFSFFRFPLSPLTLFSLSHVPLFLPLPPFPSPTTNHIHTLFSVGVWRNKPGWSLSSYSSSFLSGFLSLTYSFCVGLRCVGWAGREDEWRMIRDWCGCKWR